MSLSILYSRANAGIQAPLVTVEVHLSGGVPCCRIAGLAETAVKESRDRVRSAVMTAGFWWPSHRVTINLAPAELPKEGSRFDLPIALGVLEASKQLKSSLFKQYEWVGELALSGEIKPVRGILPIVLAAQKTERTLIIPEGNAVEAGLVKNAKVYCASHLLEVCSFLKGQLELKKCQPHVMKESEIKLDLAEVRGQPQAKRALEIAAAGKHSLLFMGPPGTGKTMLASRLPTILPALSEEEALELAAIHSMSNAGFDAATWRLLPFRSPHHSSSSVALVGGGRPPKPGEVSLAHHGVLFLDELPEFNRAVLESLREPLEAGQITISRAAFQAVFPAQFQFIAAMNPCPCGYVGHPKNTCQCSPDQIRRYLAKLSGPLLDRIDMQVEVSSLSPGLLTATISEGDKSAVIKERVLNARTQQFNRQGKYNSALTANEVSCYCQLDRDNQQWLDQIIQQFNLSARAYHRILKVSRTIADLKHNALISKDILSEALSYRHLDRSNFGL